MRTPFFIVTLFALTACSPFGGTDSTIQHVVADAANSACTDAGPGGSSDGGLVGGCGDPLPDGGYSTDGGGYNADAGAWGADAAEWGSDGGSYGGGDAGGYGGADAGEAPADAPH